MSYGMTATGQQQFTQFFKILNLALHHLVLGLFSVSSTFAIHEETNEQLLQPRQRLHSNSASSKDHSANAEITQNVSKQESPIKPQRPKLNPTSSRAMSKPIYFKQAETLGNSSPSSSSRPQQV